MVSAAQLKYCNILLNKILKFLKILKHPKILTEIKSIFKETNNNLNFRKNPRIINPLTTVKYSKTDIFIFEKLKICGAYFSRTKIIKAFALTLLERETSCLKNKRHKTSRKEAPPTTNPVWDNSDLWSSKG